MSTNPAHISIRMDPDSLETLDRLVVAVRAYYEAQPEPIINRLASETTRSSALRDLLLAWKHGKADEMFSREITKDVR